MFEKFRKTLSLVYRSAKSIPLFGLRLSGIIVTSLLNSAVSMATPFVLIQVISAFDITKVSLQTTMLIVSGYTVLWGVNRILPIVRAKIITPVSNHASVEMSTALAQQFYTLDLAYQIDNSIGEVAQHIFKSYQSVEGYVQSTLGKIIPVGVEVIGATTFLVALYGPIGLIFLAMTTGHVVVALIGSYKVKIAAIKEFDSSFQFYSHYQAAFQNYETAHLFNNVDFELARFKRASFLCASATGMRARQTENMTLIQIGVIASGVIGFTLLLAYNTSIGAYPVAEFFLLSLYLTQYGLSLNELFLGFSSFATESAYLEQIIQYLEKAPSIVNAAHAPDLIVTPKTASISFDKVRFRYNLNEPDNKPVLNELSFKVNPGQKVAVVGLSGAGKTTLAKLSLRFYQPQQGEIRISEQPISEVKLNSLRQNIAIVPQDTPLFPGTIMDNIRYGKLDATEEEIWAAVKSAGLFDYIRMLPNKLLTQVGQRGGANLSGGQRQRIAIARALLKSSPIIIFDEATSSLDIKTEIEVMESIKACTVGKTVLFITHRLYTIVDADNIILITNGQVEDQGTYDELMSRGQTFYKMMTRYKQDISSDTSSNFIHEGVSEPIVSSTSFQNSNLQPVATPAETDRLLELNESINQDPQDDDNSSNCVIM